MKRTVRIFIASSSENLAVPHALSRILGQAKRKTFKVVPAPWDQGTFKLSKTYIESLEEEMDKADFSILVLTPNDVTRIRDEAVRTPRDNVLFELGLFMGRLHRERCFMLYAEDKKPKRANKKDKKLRLPSDLLGVNAATYRKTGPAGLKEALTPACEQILDSVSGILEAQKLGRFVSQIEGAWWERIVTKSGVELSSFNVVPVDRYQSLSMRGEHFDAKGEPIGHWYSTVVGIQEDQTELFYQWEGWHPPDEEGNADKVKGFGSITFDGAKGRLLKGEGGFMDVDPNDMSTCQWKTVRLKRATRSDARTMSKGSFADKKALVGKILSDW